MKIAIRFGDNDFHSTWRLVMATLMEAYIYTEKEFTDKGELLTIINSISYGCYLAVGGNHDLSIVEYLAIKKENLLIGEEVTNYLEEKALRYNSFDDNQATTILDFNLWYKNDNPIYTY